MPIRQNLNNFSVLSELYNHDLRKMHNITNSSLSDHHVILIHRNYDFKQSKTLSNSIVLDFPLRIGSSLNTAYHKEKKGGGGKKRHAVQFIKWSLILSMIN